MCSLYKYESILLIFFIQNLFWNLFYLPHYPNLLQSGFSIFKSEEIVQGPEWSLFLTQEANSHHISLPIKTEFCNRHQNSIVT